MRASFLSTFLRKAKGLMLNRFPMMINCREFEAFMLDYLEGTLPTRQRFVFQFHLKVCRECREYLMAYSRTIDAAQRVFTDGDAPVPSDVPEDLIRAILNARDS